MFEAQVYRCQNPNCGRESRGNTARVEDTSNPRCYCGAETKKVYRKPVLRRLNPTIEMLARFHASPN